MPKRSQSPKPLFEPCVGGGIYLRPPKWADFDDWVTLRRENRAHLKPWEPSWNEAHLSRTAYRARLVQFKKMIAQDTGYPFHVFRSGDDHLVGACNITSVKRGSMRTAHIGYWVGEKYARNGFARAAVRACLRFAFEDIGLHRIEAAVRAENKASINLLEKTGFTQEGTARGMLKIDGEWRDHLMYAKLSSD
ncbi:MAG: 30S ribosomal protein S5 alanine N-acetyltransferase [Robiginitomaculum sp.]|nr:MAG: 30S ribosomal protein S5 alanine N-acetyltransferase [Robiginitomaculum sp.]